MFYRIYAFDTFQIPNDQPVLDLIRACSQRCNTLSLNTSVSLASSGNEQDAFFPQGRLSFGGYVRAFVQQIYGVPHRSFFKSIVIEEISRCSLERISRPAARAHL